MKLYEISQEIERLQERVDWDAELQKYIDLDTGEIMAEDELRKILDELQMDRQERMSYMAKCVLNDRAEVEALKAEKTRLDARRKAREKRIELFLSILDRECAGKKTDLGVATVSYRKSSPVEIVSGAEPDVVCWLEEHNYEHCLKYTDPEIRKDPLKKLIQSGEDIPYCAIIEKNNMSLN